MARMWKDLPKFGAKAISWTGSVTVMRVSAFAYFLIKKNLTLKISEIKISKNPHVETSQFFYIAHNELVFTSAVYSVTKA